MPEPKVVKPVTQEDAARMLMDASKYLASGLGFEVKYEFVNTVPGLGDIGTIEEGFRTVSKALGVIAAGAQVDPASVLGLKKPTPPKQGLVLPGG